MNGMKAFPARTCFAVVLQALVLATGLAACGGSDTTASSSPTTPPPVATTSPSAASTAGSWQMGTDSVAATSRIAKRWLATLRTERFAASGLWSDQASFDLWASDTHASGAAAVRDVYVGAAPDSTWTVGHALVSPGVVAYEGLFESGDQKPTAVLDLLAVSGGKVSHEEVYLDTSGGRSAEPVTQWPSAPTSADTVARTKRTARAFAEAATGNTLKIGLLLADDVLFYDTAQKRERRGATALLRWWGGRTAWAYANRPTDGLIVGPGWAAVRWTATGGQTSTDDITMPGAMVLEIRSGKVVRMTLYYDAATMPLHL